MAVQLRRMWDKYGAIGWVAIATALALWCGYSMGTASTVANMVESQRKERTSLKRYHAQEVRAMRSALVESKVILGRQSDQIFELSKRGAELCRIQPQQ